MNKVPHRQELMRPILIALVDLGGSGSVEEIRDKVIATLSIPDDLANEPHKTKRKGPEGRTELEYNLAWARTYLKQLGYLQNSSRGVWALTANGMAPEAQSKVEALEGKGTSEAPNLNGDWQDELIRILTSLEPATFERLVQRVLRETGFVQVQVTGRTGDGGIDGRGVAKINGILSFHVVFQCKRYKGAVSSSSIRDFRGALQGRADKGLFITTGFFTRDAMKEAIRDGAIAIDMVDGEKLAEKLKELGLGVRVEMTEAVYVEPEWFSKL